MPTSPRPISPTCCVACWPATPRQGRSPWTGCPARCTTRATSTTARSPASPFLLQAMADAHVLDRGGILGLLAGIGGAEIDDQDDTDIDDEDESSWYWNFRVAHQAVLAGYPPSS